MTRARSFKRQDAGRSDRFIHLLGAQVEVNRAVSLWNTKRFGIDRTLLDPEEFSADAIDAKIRLAIEALERCLDAPRRGKR